MFLLVLSGAGNEIRTRDPNLGKVVLYQLSYSRIRSACYPRVAGSRKNDAARRRSRVKRAAKWRPLGESNPCRRDENPVS